MFEILSSREKIGIVLAFFGTSYPSSLTPIFKTYNHIKNYFTGIDVRLAFTSSIIRRVWQERKHNLEYRSKNLDVPPLVYEIRGELASICDLQDLGKEYILVQPMHIAAMEEYHDLAAVVRALNSIRTMKPKNMPFKKIILGKPLMGSYSPDSPYSIDLERLSHALKDDVILAKEKESALVYIAHGNEYMPGGFFTEFEFILNKNYPFINSYVSLLEGFPSIDYMLERMKNDGIKRAIVKPLMIVAGEHAIKDINGDDESVRVLLTKKGIDVEIILEGLGEKESISQIFIENIVSSFEKEGIKFSELNPN